MKPNFHNINIKSVPKEKINIPQWEKDNRISKDWKPAEQIPIKSVYTKNDLDGYGTPKLCCRYSTVFAGGHIPPCM